MTSLEVIALPSFKKDQRAWLARLRATRDPDKSTPHITLVFPGSTLTPEEFTAEVKERAQGVSAISFRLCSAVVVSDPQVQAFHVFLVPDQGSGAITRLHNRLHAGKLVPVIRTDITYLPHVTVASAHSWEAAYQLATELNAQDFSVAGVINELEVHHRHDDKIRTFKVPLKRRWLLG